jgi:TetR/AcrR family transcriptional regulator, fatty acid metabolism regulator protein
MTEEHSLKRRRKATRREEILAAAHQAFVESSFDTVAMGDIARRAGCVEGTLYTYFKNKRALFDAVLAQFYDRLIAEIQPNVQAVTGTRDRLVYLVARHLQIALDEPGLARLITRESRSDSLYRGSELHRLNRRYSQCMMLVLQEGQGRGEIQAGVDIKLLRDLIFGGLEHVSWNALAQGQRLDPGKRAAQLVDLLMAGCLVREEAGLGTRVERIEAQLALLVAARPSGVTTAHKGAVAAPRAASSSRSR